MLLFNSLTILVLMAFHSVDAWPWKRHSKNSFNWDLVDHLIAFGDSYTFVQGTNGYPTFSFIGDYLPGHFAVTPLELWSDRLVQNFTGTAEGGPNWVEYLTGCGLKKGLTDPRSCKTQLWDFAFAGADVSEEFTPLHHNWTVPLVNQTQQFLTWIEPEFRKNLEITQQNTLIAIWIGINDIGDTSKFKVSFPDLYESIISTMFAESVEPLYEAGYQNFLFVNLPPLDKTPLNVVKAEPLPNKTMIDWWDDTLKQKSEAFGAQHKDTNVFLYDANSFLNHILDNPLDYGIKNSTGYCPAYLDADEVTDPKKYGCIPIHEYFWFNTGHMTSHVHRFLGSDVKKFLREQSRN